MERGLGWTVRGRATWIPHEGNIESSPLAYIQRGSPPSPRSAPHKSQDRLPQYDVMELPGVLKNVLEPDFTISDHGSWVMDYLDDFTICIHSDKFAHLRFVLSAPLQNCLLLREDFGIRAR